jgi:hypothetical protein
MDIAWALMQAVSLLVLVLAGVTVIGILLGTLTVVCGERREERRERHLAEVGRDQEVTGDRWPCSLCQQAPTEESLWDHWILSHAECLPPCLLCRQRELVQPIDLEGTITFFCHRCRVAFTAVDVAREAERRLLDRGIPDA